MGHHLGATKCLGPSSDAPFKYTNVYNKEIEAAIKQSTDVQKLIHHMKTAPDNTRDLKGGHNPPDKTP